MKIHKISLENIRSYLNQEINFPEGSISLSGDIGSGKSTILLALDFALFGLRSGSLSGGSLLRNGTNSGNVEVSFNLEGKEITLKRNLKRSSTGVSQESGHLIIDGHKEDLSPLELKDRVLQLLNYPKELLTKSKSLIYRYTVYTPQEEMKFILSAEREHRLEILRKVFGIDKYKRIKDNARIFLHYLKGERKELAGKIADLEDKIELMEEKEKSGGKLKSSIVLVEKEIGEIANLLEEKKKNIGEMDKKHKEFLEMKKQKELFDLDLKNKKIQLSDIEEQSRELQENIIKLEEELKQKVDVDKSVILKKEKLVKEISGKLHECNAQMGALNHKLTYSEEIKNKIASLDICPLCKQEVNKEHIAHVISSEDVKIDEAMVKITNLKEEINKRTSELDIVNRELEGIRNQISLLEKFQLKEDYLREKKLLFNKISEEEKKLTLAVIGLEEKIKIVLGRLENLEDLEEKLEKLNDEKEEHLRKHRKLELEKNTLETEFKSLNKQISELIEEIKQKKVSKNKLLYWTKIQNWIEDNFILMIDVIEKQTLSKVYYDFNLLFQKWFSLLVEDDNLLVSLDEEFSPLIEQNGHIIDYDYLSGGEKTAAALAYRLALNQVINVLMSTIKTRGLLILDEPTDGFSETQVDRIRHVLAELQMRQVIIVSHESKIESFVDHVIRLRKDGHVSNVVSL